MENEINPYAVSEVQQPMNFTGLPNEVEVTQRAVTAMLATRFWMMLVAGGVLILFFFNVSSLFSSFLTMSYLPIIINTLFYGLFAFHLFHCARQINRFKHNQTSANLELHLNAQAAFWRTWGIVTFALLILIILFAFLGAFLA